MYIHVQYNSSMNNEYYSATYSTNQVTSESSYSRALNGRRWRPLVTHFLVSPPPPPTLTFMVWSYILLRVAAGADHHIWCSAWGRLVSCHVPAIPWRYTSASPRRFGVFSFAFANEILFAWLYTGRLSLWISLYKYSGRMESYLFYLYQPISPIEIKDVFFRGDLAKSYSYSLQFF